MECSVPGARLSGVVVPSLVAAFGAIPDPRRAASVRYPLPALLALVVLGLLAQQESVLGIAEWAAHQEATLLAAVGLPSGASPCQSTLHRVLAQLDPVAVGQVLAQHFQALVPADPAVRGGQAVAVDGKALRGARRGQVPAPPTVQLLTAFCHDQQVVLAQVPVHQTTERHAAELTVASDLLGHLDWQGRVLTGDALYCQRALCQQVLAGGGDYCVVVKDNQATLKADIALLFASPPPATTVPTPDRRCATTQDWGHGRTHEQRTLVASSDLNAYLDWPGVAQVFQLTRTWQEHGHPQQHVTYGLTSLPPDQAGPPRLLALRRGHWQIENALHYVKDVVLREDASLVHHRAGPLLLALLRNTALNLLRLTSVRAVTSQRRTFACRPAAALALLIMPLATRA